jgi:WD40 repeat protein
MPSGLCRLHWFGIALILPGVGLGLSTCAGADAPKLPGLVAILHGHTEALYGLAFSPDSSQVASASFDKTIKIWEAVTGKEIQTLGGSAGHQNLVLSVAFSPNGRLLASGGVDNTARIWETSPHIAFKAVAVTAHPNLVDAVAFSPGSDQLATGCHDGAVRIWDAKKGQQIRQINAHTTPAAPVYCLAWTPDGKQIFSGSMDHTMKLWDAGSGKLVREFKKFKEKEFEKGHRDAVFSMAQSPDGKMLASGSSDHTIKLWNVADGAVTAELANPSLKATPGAPAGEVAHPGWVYGLRFTPDGKYLISVGNAPQNQGYLGIWDIAARKLKSGLTLAIGPIYALAVSPKGDLLALGCGPESREAQDGKGYILRLAELTK